MEKKRYLWLYNWELEMALLNLRVYNKTEDEEFKNFSLRHLEKAKDYKSKLKTL